MHDTAKRRADITIAKQTKYSCNDRPATAAATTSKQLVHIRKPRLPNRVCRTQAEHNAEHNNALSEHDAGHRPNRVHRPLRSAQANGNVPPRSAPPTGAAYWRRRTCRAISEEGGRAPSLSTPRPLRRRDELIYSTSNVFIVYYF